MTEKSLFLKVFFEELNNYEVNYCVLRGYELLPNEEINDIDFGVFSRDVKLFFNIINLLSHKYKYRVNVKLIRLNVIKTELLFENNTIDIDIWWDFNYVGLKYIDIIDLLSSKKKYNGIINIPSSEYEFALSFLKELLHNNWIREDKRLKLKSNIKAGYYKPFAKYFKKKNVNEFIEAVEGDRVNVKDISYKAKFNLVLSNLKYFGIIKLTRNVYNFMKIRFFYKDDYKHLIGKL